VSGIVVGDEKYVTRNDVGDTNSITIHDFIPSKRSICRQGEAARDGEKRPKGASNATSVMGEIMSGTKVYHFRVPMKE
jgi:hypothetical protein